MSPNPPAKVNPRQSVIHGIAYPIDYPGTLGDDPSMESDTEETGWYTCNLYLLIHTLFFRR